LKLVLKHFKITCRFQARFQVGSVGWCDWKSLGCAKCKIKMLNVVFKKKL
jgi:hypothetical protein